MIDWVLNMHLKLIMLIAVLWSYINVTEVNFSINMTLLNVSKNEFFSIPEFLSIIEAELFANIILNEVKKFENSFQVGLKL